MATGYAIKWLKDKLGVKFFPVTHIKAVRDDNNIDLDVLLGRKQDTLVSGTNIKTINNTSILGSGNIEVSVPTKTSDLTNDSGFITSADIPEGATASTTPPKMDGIPTVGVELAFARGDHRHPSDINKADKSTTVSTITYNTTSKKITKTINGTTTDVVTAARIITDGGGITSHQDISGKADKATTLAGYGITDAKIANGTITLGNNTITPLTSFIETDPVFSTSVAAEIKASDITNWNNKTSNTGTITGVSVNGTSVATSGVANITSMPASILSGAIKNGVTATTQASGDNSTKVATTAYVDTAINNLPEPMIFKGSLGTGGTITSLPAASVSNTGFTYKVITAGTYVSQAAKVGDTFISDGTTWNLIPSGDEPDGTVTSVTLKANSPISINETSAITTSGTRIISHASSGVTAGTYRSVTVNATGHVIAGTNPTTLAGYGITDAKIANGVITLGNNTITPLTSHQSLSNYVTIGTAQTIRAKKTFSAQQAFTVASGTSPFTVTSTTKVDNLNADTIDGIHANELFTSLTTDSTTSANQLSITIGGTTKTLDYYAPSLYRYIHTRISTTTGGWYKIFTVTINARYAYGSANFMLTDLGRPTSGDSRQSHIVCHFQQQNAFGSAPFVNLYILDGNCGTQYLKGVYTLNSDSTTIDIYTCASYIYMRPMVSNIGTYVSTGSWEYPTGDVVDAPTFNIDSKYQTQMQAQNFNSTVYSKFMYFRNNANDANAGYIGAGSTANNNIALMAYRGNNLLLGANGTTQATFDGSKLELEGATSTPLKLKGNNSDSTWISFYNSSDTLIGFLGTDSANGGLRYSNGTSYWNVLHTGNYSTYLDNVYVNKTGDTMTNTLNVSGDNHSFKIIGSSYTFGLHMGSSGTNRGIYQWAPTNKWLLYFAANNTILNQGSLDLTEGSIITTHGSTNYVNGSKNAVINCNYTSYGAILNAPVKSGRISMNTYPQSDDYVRLSYFTADNVTNNVNTQTHQLRWLATTGQLLLDGHLNLEGANTSSSTSNTTQIIFRSSSTEQVAISSNTNTLIINPTSSATTGQIVLGVNGKNTCFTSSGKFGIGVNSPSQKLHVSGNILATGEITAYSDIRLKKNIKPLQVRGELKPMTYEKDGKQSIGFIALDVLEIYPELVTEQGEDKMLSLNYAQLTAVLQAEILELKEEIKKLKNNK